MELDEDHTIFIDRQSSQSDRSLKDLVKEAYGTQIGFFDVSIGSYIKQWRGVKVGHHLVYTIDNVGACGCEVSHIVYRAFRPLWKPDHDTYKSIVHFARAMCCETFTDAWIEEMVNKHIEAIDKKLWFFMVFAVVVPKYKYQTNKVILDAKIEEMETAQKEMEEMMSIAYGCGGG